MTWDPAVYGRYATERDRPFHELVGRVQAEPEHVVDLGCGSGHLTRVLADRWPHADVVGIDSSTEMLAQAARDPGHVRFVHEDLAAWRPERPVDLIVSNAALHWVPDHPGLLRRLVGHLSDHGVLAVQVPYNFDASSHRIVREAASRPPWSTHCEDVGAVHVLAPEDYLRILHDEGLAVDLWSTTYHHVLQGEDAVLHWLEGTTLRPYFGRLPADEAEPFRRVLQGALRAAYPAEDGRVVFPFTRLFFVASKHRTSTPSKPREA